jgi:hypothetical protein
VASARSVLPGVMVWVTVVPFRLASSNVRPRAVRTVAKTCESAVSRALASKCRACGCVRV